jgi:hypothetical protein
LASRRRSFALVFAVLLFVADVWSHGAEAAVADPPPTPQAECGPGSRPETGLQGQMSAAHLAAGDEGFSCNAEAVGRFGPSDEGRAGAGGYKVFRYVDGLGHECAYYDSTLLFPLSVVAQLGGFSGVHVLDMGDPSRPVKTANLLTPAMQSPHESLSFNATRGLLAAGMGTPATAPGMVDIYDLSGDCRNPQLRSTLPVGILGHEGNFSPDGNTLWISSVVGSITAIDVRDPDVPMVLWASDAYRFHGLTISRDGNRLYAADLGEAGLRILDVSEIQARVTDPQVREVSHATWPVVTIPQQPMPVRVSGHPYLVEVDEFTRDNVTGAARVIDISDEGAPSVVSDLRLEVNQQANRRALANDPGYGNELSDYSAHYCAVPREDEPRIVACSFVLSGLRVFGISDPRAPTEIAYFNPSVGESESYAMSAPAFAPERCEVWYTDGNKGFWAVKITNGMWPGCGSASS